LVNDAGWRKKGKRRSDGRERDRIKKQGKCSKKKKR